MKQIKIFYYTNFNGEFVDFYCTDGTTVQITLQDLLKEINRFTELEGDGYNDAMTKFKKDLNNCWRHILREDEIYKMLYECYGLKNMHKDWIHNKNAPINPIDPFWIELSFQMGKETETLDYAYKLRREAEGMQYVGFYYNTENEYNQQQT